MIALMGNALLPILPNTLAVILRAGLEVASFFTRTYLTHVLDSEPNPAWSFTVPNSGDAEGQCLTSHG